MEVSDAEEERDSPTERTALEAPVVVPQYLKSAPVKKIRHPTDRRIVPVVLISTCFAVGGLAFGLPVVAILTVAVVVASVLRVAIASCCASRLGYGLPGCSRYLSASDAFWLHDLNAYVAHCLFFVERGLDVRTTRQILQSRVLDKTTENGERAFARFTQKVVSVSAGYCWVDDTDFDIEQHVFEEARRVRTRHQLRNLISQLMSHAPLAPNRPLWEVRMVRDYGMARDTVLIVRVHHALSDGVALVKVLGNFLADHPQMLRLKPRHGGLNFPLNVFRAAAVAPLSLLGWLLFRRRDYNPVSHRQPFTSRRTVGWSAGIRAATVDRIRQVARCSVNDVLLAAARGALRDYFKHCGVRCPPDVTVNLPLDLRYEPAHMESFPELGTGFALVNARLPVRTEGAIPGLWDVRHRMERLKASCDPVVMYGALHYLSALLPASLCRWLLRAALRCASLRFCSLQGPERRLTLASRRLKSATFWMDAHPEVPVAFCVFSYAGSFYVGVSADSGTIASPKVLVKGFTSHLERLYSIIAKRKIPGQERRRSSFTAERRREEIFKPSVKEIQGKLHAVQVELHDLSRQLELSQLPGYVAPDQAPAPAYRRALAHRLEELKEEFVELITELRKRKALAGGVALDMEDCPYDPDLDGPLRCVRPSTRRPSFNALTTLLSTSRPLLTQYAPTAAQQALYHVPSDPDMEGRGTPEQQRALIARSKEDCYVSRNSGLYRRDLAI
ncbi:uncharacterized protein LOC129216483 [Uloborus diversus]|uniref:uncharacterized protein LOC129216483 n=1 Tax=Uloborus diversus TaxID=327109 RepID=UPI00240A2E19|nr:uncharacterized protein LOC129216483 [Uloborus diversus]